MYVSIYVRMYLFVYILFNLYILILYFYSLVTAALYDMHVDMYKSDLAYNNVLESTGYDYYVFICYF